MLKARFFLGLWRIEAFYARLFSLYPNLPAFSVVIALVLASTQDHAHNWLFELSTLIGQYLNY